MMPLAPSYEFHTRVVDKGVEIQLCHPATGRKKEFFLAGIKDVGGIDVHMLSLTESQCDQFLAEKKAIVKEKKEKKPLPEKKAEETTSIKESFRSFVDGEWVKVFKD